VVAVSKLVLGCCRKRRAATAPRTGRFNLYTIPCEGPTSSVLAMAVTQFSNTTIGAQVALGRITPSGGLFRAYRYDNKWHESLRPMIDGFTGSFGTP
jgi:hypothetical protein